MIITIPSKGRVDAQLTWNAIPEEAREKFKMVVVCEPSEVSALGRHNIRAVAYRGKGTGIGAKRQWIMENLTSHDPIIAQFDDDLNIWGSRSMVNGKAKYLRATPDQIVKGLDEFALLLNSHAAGALGGRGFAQDRPLVDKKPARLVRALGYNMSMMPTGVKFRMPTCEDLDMQLQLLRAGCDIFMFYGLVQEQKGSNLPGGCSEYRDLPFQAEQYRKLAEYHPGFATPVMRTYRRGWDGMDKTQPSININWRSAAAAGKRSKA